jgi:hypothetical protein
MAMSNKFTDRSLLIDLLGAAEKLRLYSRHDASCHSDNSCVCGYDDVEGVFVEIRKLVYDRIGSPR